MVQMMLGFDWTGSCFSCFDLKIGVFYELQYFWNTWRNQNSYIQNLYVTDAGYSDLMLQGITLKAFVEF